MCLYETRTLALQIRLSVGTVRAWELRALCYHCVFPVVLVSDLIME
jgi:hypothetical protein